MTPRGPKRKRRGRVPTGPPRHYGSPPYRTVLVHGGPGARGSLAPLAQELGQEVGVLEPWQSALTVRGEVEELSTQIVEWADPPVVLVGHSWGAWLSLLLAAKHPGLVRGVVLVGCGPLTPRHGREVSRLRRARLSVAQRTELDRCEESLRDASRSPSAAALRRLEALTKISDSYELLPHPARPTPPDPAVFRSVWGEAERMRSNGRLVAAVRRVRSSIVVIHGDVDPHPIQGVVEPLRRLGLKPRVVRLSRCGHEPWQERYAHARFVEEVRGAIERFPAVEAGASGSEKSGRTASRTARPRKPRAAERRQTKSRR